MPILLGVTLGAILIFCGSCNVIAYGELILDNTGAELNYAKTGIVVGVFHLLGLVTSMIFVDMMGRRKLLLISSGCAAFSSFFFGLLAILYIKLVELGPVQFIPVLLLSSYVFSLGVGLVPIPYLMFSELVTSEVMTITIIHLSYNINKMHLLQFRPLGVTLNILAISIFGCISNLVFPYMTENWELAIAMWLSAAICLLGFAFVYFALPETTGKNLDSIDSDRSDDDSSL